ncbi:hypothetical protein [Actinokineospora sp. NPDC004072]
MTGRGAAAAEFARRRSHAESVYAEQRRRAARAVANHALSAAERMTLLAMLDLPAADAPDPRATPRPPAAHLRRRTEEEHPCRTEK